jgi:hypothetical protein
MDNVDLDMLITDPGAFDELKKLVDFLPDDEAKTAFLNTVAQKLLDL